MSGMQWDKIDGQSAEETGGTGRPLAVEDDAEQMPLNMLSGGGIDADAIINSDSSGRRSPAGGVLMIAGVLLVGGAALAAMRATGNLEMQDKAAAAAEKKIDQALARLSSDARQSPLSKDNLDQLFKDPDQVIAVFTSDPTAKQVDLEHLQKNPFELFVVKPAPGSASSPVAAKALDKEKEEKLKKLRAELGSLKLQSLLSGTRSLAVINGKVVREGDTVGSFAVTSISPSGVRLTHEGNTYTLAMDTPGEN